jgi:ADP-heptose:LPS heptosyltransferase
VPAPGERYLEIRSRPVRKLLLVRTDNIGDAVLSLPVATFLKRRFSLTRIDFLARAYAAPVLDCCSAVDQVFAVEEMGDAADWFARAGYDLVIYLIPDRRVAAAAKRGGVAFRIGTSHRWFHWFACNLLAHFSRKKSTLHEAQLNFRLLEPLGIRHVPSLADLPTLFALSAPATTVPLAPPLAQSEQAAGFKLVLHPKSNSNGREWPVAHFEKLARLLLPHPGVRLFVTGSAAEGEWLALHAAGLLQMANVTNLCGQLSLDQLVAFLAAADGMIASGTGPLHIAAALGRPTLGLFPPRAPIFPARWGALGSRAQSLCLPGSCSLPCSTTDCACMQALQPEAVQAIVLGWMARKAQDMEVLAAPEAVVPGAPRAD